MAVKRCNFCRTHIEWMMTRFGKRLPFEYERVSTQEDEAWIPGRWQVGPGSGPKRIVLAPVTHYSAARRERIQRGVRVHQCEAYRKLVSSVDATVSGPLSDE